MYRILCVLVVLLAGCQYNPLRPYKIDIPQGNVLEAKKISQLRHGMTRQQVSYLMGSPVAVDAFNPDRWVYLYYLKPGYHDAKRDQLTLYFKDGNLIRAEGNTGEIKDSQLLN